jgi:flagellar protein FliS
MAVNPYAKYKEQSIMTMTQGEMVVRLYDEIDNQLNRAVVAIEQKDPAKANQALQKSQRIIMHLKSTLNHNYEVAGYLNRLYDFFLSQILEANIKKNTKPINDIMPLIVELRDTFSAGERLARIG